MDITQPPQPRLWNASERDAVQLCQEWMIYLGAVDAVTASGAASEVCDLYSTRFLGWVDNRRKNLDVELVQKAARIAASDGRRPLVFCPGGVFPDAQDQADALGVALLRYDMRGGDLDGANVLGRLLRATGLAAR